MTVWNFKEQEVRHGLEIPIQRNGDSKECNMKN